MNEYVVTKKTIKAVTLLLCGTLFFLCVAAFFAAAAWVTIFYKIIICL